ncbi:MAG: TonB-dependent receptor [Pseudohongiellaceae bacterium]
MRNSYSGKRKTLVLAVMMAGASLPAFAQDQDESQIEEVLVTGSYIRGTPLDAPSPVQVVDRESIEAQGAAIIWDVIKNLEVNSGSITNPGSGDNSQIEGTANVNLRNLGENSTLTLINGKRQVPAAANTRSGGEFVDLNAIPLVMTERVEVLTDGGSALYGADAVAGVVNVIMRTEFEGLEIYGDIQGIEDAGDLFDATASAIWGWASDDGATHFVLSGERFERDPVSVRHGNYFDANSQFLGTVGSAGTLISSEAFGGNLAPGWLNQEVIDHNLANDGDDSAVYTDPGCYTVNSHDGSPLLIGTLREQRGERSGTCREDNSQWNYISQEAERNSIAGAFNHSFDNGVDFYSFFQYSDQETIRADDGYNQSRGPTVFLAQPGAYIRNPAYGGNAIGQTMELGFFAPNIGLTRPTEADISNAPISAANGGPNVAMYQGVRDGLPRTGADNNTTWTNTTGVQAGFRGEFELGERLLNYDLSASWSGSSLEQTYKSFNRDRSELAANGLGGPNCTPNGVPDFDFGHQPGPFGGAVPQIWEYYYQGLTQTFFPGFVFTTRENLSYALTSNNHGQGGCEFYNPYLSSLTNPELGNSRELMDWMNEEINVRDKRNKLMVFDAVVSGELMEMRGGTAAFALGGQYRERTAHSRAAQMNLPGLPSRILDYDENGVPNEYHYVSNNFDCSNCAYNYDHTREVKAVFAEFSLPFWDNVESQVALRYEDYGGQIGAELSPKLALSWRPVETLLLRGSWSQSFRAPNIAIVFEGLEAAGATFRDPIRNQDVRAGLLPPTNENAIPGFTYTLGGPAPDVGNEYADTYSTGFLWTPQGQLDGLSIGADFWRFEVSDRVLPQPPISALQPEIDAFIAASQNPDNYIYNDSIPASQTLYPEPYFACDTAALEAQYGRDSEERANCVVDPRSYVAPGIQRAFGVTTASLITLTLGAVNAGEIESDGVDVRMGYNWENDWGRFSLGLDYTHVRQYKLLNVPGLELGLLDIGVFDAAGTTGDGNLVRSLPDNKGHLTFGWQRDNHGVTLINRHIGSYKDLSYDATYQNGSDFTRSLLTKDVASYDTWDMQYRYSHTWGNANLGTTNFVVGLLDAFNEELPYREASGLNYDAGVFDGRGRRFYVRALWQF